MRATLLWQSAVVVVLISCAGARAQLLPPDDPAMGEGAPGVMFDEQDALRSQFALGIGYAHLAIGGSDSALESEDALRFDPALTFAPFRDLPQLRIGGALGVTMVLDNSQFAFVSNGGAVFVGHSDVPLWLLEPELRASWQQPFGRSGEFFVEPGVAIGAVYGQLSIHAEDTHSGQSFDESDGTATGRVFLNLGARVPGGYAGIQASYARGGKLHFADNASGDFEQYYIGIFGAARF
jgi:hypothetical protein